MRILIPSTHHICKLNVIVQPADGKLSLSYLSLKTRNKGIVIIVPSCFSPAPQRKRLVRLKLTADDSSVDMTDLAVMESILKWVITTFHI